MIFYLMMGLKKIIIQNVTINNASNIIFDY